MQQTLVPMTMQQSHTHLRRHRDRLRATIPACRFRVEDGFAAGAGGKVDEEGPRCAGRDGSSGGSGGFDWFVG